MMKQVHLCSNWLVFRCVLLIIALGNGAHSVVAQRQPFSIQSDSIYLPKGGIYFHPLALVSASFCVGYEHRIRPDMSVSLILSYARKEGSNLYELYDYSKTTIEAQYRYYFEGVALNGIYIGGYTYYRQIGIGIYPQIPNRRSPYSAFTRGSAHAIGLGYITGFQYFLHKRVAFDVYFGGGMKWAFFRGASKPYIAEYTNLRYNRWDDYRNAVRLNFGMNLGILLY
jgi:hypothetical protein